MIPRSKIHLLTVLFYIVFLHPFTDLELTLQTILPTENSEQLLYHFTTHLILSHHCHQSQHTLLLDLSPHQQLAIHSSHSFAESRQTSWSLTPTRGYILHNPICTVKVGHFYSLRVVLATLIRVMIRSVWTCFSRKVDREIQCIAGRVSLNTRCRVYPEGDRNRSARACCLALEKLSLATGGFGPMRECANREAGPYCATTKVLHLKCQLLLRVNSNLGWGGYTNSSSSVYSSRCIWQSILKNVQIKKGFQKQSAVKMSSSILFPTNEYAVSSKSHEEIMKLTTPPNMPLEQYLEHIATKGLPPQFPFLYKNIHQAYSQTLSFACSKAPSQSPENQILIAESLTQLLSLSPCPLDPDQLELVFNTGLDCLNNLQSPSNEQLSRVVELSMAQHPFSKKLIGKLQKSALELGRPPQPIISKVTSCRLISLLALYLNRTLKGEMIDILKRVLSDSEPEVRKVWVVQFFPKLLKNLDLQFIELHLQEKIYEAVWDQNQEIAALALETILKNAGKFSSEEQGTRIVKLFIDSLTCKRQRLAVLSSQLLGPAYQKLLPSILSSESLCIRFWKSLIQLATSKNQTILNNLIYNLPGILALTVPLHKIDSMCDVYIQLFYQRESSKEVLGSYFHEIVQLFPNKGSDLKEVVYWMFAEMAEEETPCQQAMKILLKIMKKLQNSKTVFLDCSTLPEGNQEHLFEQTFCEYFLHFYQSVQNTNNSLWLSSLHLSISHCYQHFPSEFLQSTLLPKLYQSLRSKAADSDLLAQTLVKLATRDSNPSVINIYTSKISVELCKSSKSYERETALLFLYHATFYCSIDMFQEYRLGEKYLSFNTDKNFKVKTTFLRYLPRLLYFLTREEKIEFAIIVSRYAKDTDYQIQQMMGGLCLEEREEEKQGVVGESRKMRERQKQKMVVLNVRKQNVNRRASKQLKKDDILKKRMDATKSKPKIMIKDVAKKKVAPILLKTTSNFHLKKHS